MSEFSVPEQVADALTRGRCAYVAQEFLAAKAADREALELAELAGSQPGAARANRLLGLCSYRLGEIEASAVFLEQALKITGEIGWESERLLVCNHLGATYRQLGRLDDAENTLRDAIERADPRTHLEARARLMGSYGAFLDDLGDSQAAAEHYARYEELLGLLDDPGRLANARGLVSRVTRLRGDLTTALLKAEEERRLGAESGLPVREGRGWMHIAQVHEARGDSAEAERAFVEADALLCRGDVRAPIEIATVRGRFLLGQGQLHEAYKQVERSLQALEVLSPGEHRHRARVYLLAAEVTAEAGLHGEALWYLAKTLESELARFEPIASDKLRQRTKRRREQLSQHARRLIEEVNVVERTPEEVVHVEELLRRLGTDAPRQATPGLEPIGAWRQRVRSGAATRWERLLPGVFTGLSEQSKTDLILADIVSQGPVGDLSRSVFLLFTILERELRSRVLDPLRKELSPGHKPPENSSVLHRLLVEKRPVGIGEVVDAILQSPQGFADSDPRVVLARWTTTRGEPQEERLTAALQTLQQKIKRVDGVEVDRPLAHRNAIAHGRSSVLPRVDADAIRRVLTLGAGAVLVTTTAIPVS